MTIEQNQNGVWVNDEQTILDIPTLVSEIQTSQQREVVDAQNAALAWRTKTDSLKAQLQSYADAGDPDAVAAIAALPASYIPPGADTAIYAAATAALQKERDDALAQVSTLTAANTDLTTQVDTLTSQLNPAPASTVTAS